eukprot:SAG31_NODE_986_length_10547_cov_5.126627_11_plen_210_part_00
MKLSYAITVCDEFLEIQRLLPFIIKNKRFDDEVVVLVDLTKNSPTSELLGYLHKLSSNNHITLSEQNFNGDFARWKNLLNRSCSGDYIFQIDADEMLTDYMMKIIPQVIESNPVDLIRVPRINTVDGLTDEHIKKWGWNINDKGWVNYPDYQWRIYKNDPRIQWYGEVHEKIIGHGTFAHLPMEETELVLRHDKTITKQEKQNNYYNTL